MMFINEENSELRNKVFPLTKGIRKHLEKLLSTYEGDKTLLGYKRLKNLVNSENGVSYLDMKRIKNFFDTYAGTKKANEYNLNGGDEMRWWVENTLNTARKQVDDFKRAKMDAGISNAYKRPHEKNRQTKKKNRPTGVKFRTTNRNLLNNKTLRYENKSYNMEKKYIHLTESALRNTIRSIVENLLTDCNEESMDGGSSIDGWDVSNALKRVGWCYVNAYEVQNRTTGQCGVRFELEKDGRDAVDEDELERVMKGAFGKNRVMFSKGTHRYAPELSRVSMIVLD